MVTLSWFEGLFFAEVGSESLAWDDDFDLGCCRLGAFAAADADGQRKNLPLLFERKAVGDEGENAG